MCSNSDDLTNVNNGLVFNGTAEANAAVDLLRDGAIVASGSADGLGNWSLTDATGPLTDGSYAYTAQATDAAGNLSAESSALTVTIDTAAPAVSAPDLDPASDSGALNNDDLTNDTRPDLQRHRRGESPSSTCCVTAPSSPAARPRRLGTWSLTDANGPPDRRQLRYTARATDAAGNLECRVDRSDRHHRHGRSRCLDPGSRSGQRLGCAPTATT